MNFLRRWPAKAVDGLCVGLIMWLSAAPYMLGLGFYSDDWEFLSRYTSKLADGSFAIIATGLQFPGLVRPLHGLYAASLFSAFGTSPAPYHVVNTIVLVACAVLLWRLVGRLTGDRRIALGVAISFALLPQLSTVRMWFAAFQIPMSLLFFLIAALCELRWARGGRIGWKIASLAAGAACLGFYEIFGPLLGAIAVVSTVIRARGFGGHWIRAGLPQVANIALVLIAMILKSHVSTRASPITIQLFRNVAGQMIYPQHDWRIDHGLNLKSGFIVHFWDTLVLPFASVVRVLRSETAAPAMLVALLIGAIAYWRLAGLRMPLPGRRCSGRMLVAGLLLFCLGYATFLFSGAVGLSPAGMANRTAAAAAIGLAVILAGAAQLIASLLPDRVQGRAFAGGIAAMALLAALRIADIGGHWAAAATRQQQILAAAKTDLAGVPAGSTVVIDGVCPYVGPAPVFETIWDAGGALSITLGRKLEGDIVSDLLARKPTALVSTIYGEDNVHPYGPQLILYNPVRHWVVPLPDAAAASRYFARDHRFDAPCPRSYLSHGEPI